jgi:hypothetical protein
MLPFASQDSAATLVADRMKFLEALRFILFDYDARHKLRERSQLHKILEQNTWIFGEEYNLCASDKDLTTVLKAHREKLDPDLVIDDPVKVINKTRGSSISCCRARSAATRRMRASSRDQAWLQRPYRRSCRASASALSAAICCASAIS